MLLIRALFVPWQVNPFVAGVAAQVRHDLRERGGRADAAREAPHLLRLLRLALGRPRTLAHGLGGQQVPEYVWILSGKAT